MARISYRPIIFVGSTKSSGSKICQSLFIQLKPEIMSIIPKKKMGRRRNNQRWAKSPEGDLKINCDASFSPATVSGGWGYVIRDSDDIVISVGRGHISYLIIAFQVEVIACFHGIRAATDLGIANAILEIDATLVHQACISSCMDLSITGNLLAEIKDLILLNFASFIFLHISRDCNKVAHALTSLGCDCNGMRIRLWMSSQLVFSV